MSGLHHQPRLVAASSRPRLSAAVSVVARRHSPGGAAALSSDPDDDVRSNSAVVPLMLGHGTGSEIRQPLGFSMVGGLIVSQALTLFTTAVIYLYLDRLQQWLGGERGEKAKWPKAETPAAPVGAKYRAAADPRGRVNAVTAVAALDSPDRLPRHGRLRPRSLS